MVLTLLVARAGTSLAQTGSPAPRNVSGDHDPADELFRIIREVLTSVEGGTRGKLLDFFETIELWDAETEIDRLVGNPWELHDSTAYKLRLLPLRLAFPVYGQLADQMTGLDDRRGLRIQNLGVDEVDRMAVTLTPRQDLRLQDFLQALLGQFSVREFADLSVFVLSHQPFFPGGDDEWQRLKHRLARGKLGLVAGVLALGGAFDAAAFATSGSVVKLAQGRYALGWYGGVRHVGRRLQPQLRGGVTARAPGLEMALGLREQLNPYATDPRRSIELALREGWLSSVSRPSGWDAFFEGAVRRVIEAEPQYQGERTTGRLGVFARHEGTSRLNYLVFRSSAELESDFRSSARFVVGLGFDHPRSGLATLLQSSRTAVRTDAGQTHETRAGLFVAGTVEPPNRFVLDVMHADARLARDEWEALTAAPDSEVHLARLASALASYLESRRKAYTILRWSRLPGDLHGPLDAEILVTGRRLVSRRFAAVAAALEDLSARLASQTRRADEIHDILERTRNDPDLTDAYRAELAALDRIQRRESERVTDTLLAYHHYRAALSRMAAASPPSAPAELDPVTPFKLRRLTALSVPRLY
jgi:hypothetical protein